MWLEAFHLLMNVHHGYAIGRMLSVNYSGVTNSYLIVMRDMGFRYLTVWNLIIQCAYFSACTMEHVLRVVVGDSQPVLKRWQKLRETVFQALIFPMGLVVPSVFWVLFSYDRSMVYPDVVDRYLAPHVNHMMHTSVGVAAVLEMLLRPHHYNHRGRQLGILLFFCCSYLVCYCYTYWSRGVWIYPLYYHMNWSQQLLMNVLVTFIVPSACYLLGEKMANVIWGKRIYQANEEEKKRS